MIAERSEKRCCMGGSCSIRETCAKYYAEGIPADARMCSPGTYDAWQPMYPQIGAWLRAHVEDEHC